MKNFFYRSADCVRHDTHLFDEHKFLAQSRP